MIRLNEAQYRKVKKLTRRLCANNDGGCCLLLDDGDPCVCVQAISFSLLCRYFREAVLPNDPELEAALQALPTKRCQHCGKPFPVSGRRVYCSEKCADAARKKQTAARVRKHRNKATM